MRKFQGFTLIELLIVIAIIAVLAALTFVALNPVARFQDSHNAERWTDVSTILSAIKLHQVDNNGEYLSIIDELTAGYYYQIGTGESCSGTCSNPSVELQTVCADISDLVSDGYLSAVPIDPSATEASANETGYYLSKNSNGTITVGSCFEELGSNSSIPQISVSR